MGKNETAKAVKMIAYRIGQAVKERKHGEANKSQYLTVFYEGVGAGLKMAWYDVNGKIWREIGQ